MIHPKIAMQALRAAGKVRDGLWTQYCKMMVDTAGQAPDHVENEAIAR